MNYHLSFFHFPRLSMMQKIIHLNLLEDYLMLLLMTLFVLDDLKIYLLKMMIKFIFIKIKMIERPHLCVNLFVKSIFFIIFSILQTHTHHLTIRLFHHETMYLQMNLLTLLFVTFLF